MVPRRVVDIASVEFVTQHGIVAEIRWPEPLLGN